MISVLAVGLCLVASSYIVSVKSSLTVQRSSVVLIGEKVELKCSVTENDVASWKYTSWNTSTDADIYLGRDIITSMKSRYTIKKNISGQHNLIIDSADLAHAGRYQCTGVQKALITDVQLIVIDGPRNLSIVEYEDYLECSAEGNPTPIFKWIDVVANKSINGSIYTLNLTNDKEHTLYCTAENMYASLSKQYIIKDRAKDSDMNAEVSSSPIGLKTHAIAGSLLVLLIIIILLSCVVYRRRLKGDSSVRPDVALNTDLTSHGSDNAVYDDVCKPEGGRRSDSLSRAATIHTATSTRRNPRITAAGAEYCSIANRSSASQKPQIYCELSFMDQPKADHINPSLAEQKVPNAEAIYSEITDLH